MTEPAPRALRIERLVLAGFRNLAALDLAPGPRFNVIHGENGAGKSNLLEAVHVLGALKSFRGAKAEDMIARRGQTSRLEARVAGGAVGLPSTYRVTLDRDAPRQATIDGKRPRSTASWVGSIQVVVFHPGDIELAGGAPDARRAFLDRVLEQLDSAYASALAGYSKALRSRNRLLRTEGTDRRAITAYDELLASAGSVIGQTRAAIVEDVAPLAEHAFEEVTGSEVRLTVTYRPRVAPDVGAIREALARSLEKDLARGFTAEGPHADDVELRVEDARARHHASQGQQRAIVLALKIAELDVLARRVGRVPILLLDDVSSELDRRRNERLMERLARMGGQVFLTTTHPEFIRLSRDRVDFQVDRGRVTSGA